MNLRFSIGFLQIPCYFLMGLVSYLVVVNSPFVWWFGGTEYLVLFIIGIIWVRKKLRNQKGKQVHNDPEN